ncbi:MAG: sulfate permease, SulP family, partial [Actinomycetota bacterium]|nr:sulfate permease, SulP family [Actinomycetota bacterium]
LAAGLTGAAITGVLPKSPNWVAYASIIALLTGGMLVIARVFRLGFFGDFLSSSVLVGFLTGIGVHVMTGELPAMLGIPKEGANWLSQQWYTITHVADAKPLTVAFAAGTIAIIVCCRRFAPRVPGAILAVAGSIAVSVAIDAKGRGVAVVGDVTGGFPPVGVPQGFDTSDAAVCLGIAFSCFVLVIAQSAATSRSFAMKHGQKVDLNRDIVGLAAAEFGAGLSGTFVVNGSPTKTEILDESKGRTQVANLTMAFIALLVTLFLTALLANMPEAVLGAIVFLIGLGLVDYLGLRHILRLRRSEGVIALITAVVVCVVGVEQGIVLAVVMSIIWLIRRQYRPEAFILKSGLDVVKDYVVASGGQETLPGLIVFRYDADLFFANASRFVDDVEGVFDTAPTPVRLFVLDCSVISDVDYSASLALLGLVGFVHARGARFGLVGADPALVANLNELDLTGKFSESLVFNDFTALMAAYEQFQAEDAQGS